MMTSEKQVAVASTESRIDPDPGGARLAPIWDGILHEFRNHLTGLLAVAGGITDRIFTAIMEKAIGRYIDYVRH